MKIRFRLRSSRIQKNKAILYLRVTLNKQRIELGSTNLEINPKYWKSKEQRLIGKDADLINFELDTIRQKLNEIKIYYQAKQLPLSGHLLKQLYIGKNELSYTYSQMYVMAFEVIKQNKNLSNSSIESYNYRNSVINRFLEKKNFTNLFLEEYTLEHIQGLDSFLLETTKAAPGYRLIVLTLFQRIFSFATINNYILKNPFLAFQLPSVPKNKPIFLDYEQIQLIKNYQFRRCLQQTADCFLFSCYTGLAYSDLKKLSGAEFQTKLDRHWIIIQRTKTIRHQSESITPVMKVAKDIWDKYEGKLPMMVNTTMNENLKEIAAILNFDINLKMHTARKSFANLFLNHFSFPIEAVSAMMGHKSIKELVVYARVNEIRIGNEIRLKNLEDIFA